MNVALYLMNRKGLAVLNAAVSSGVEIAYVVTGAATGMNDDSHHVIKNACDADGIPWYAPAVKVPLSADVALAAGWRKLLDHPRLVVLHDSLLPRYRGFSPLITALVNGDSRIGVTAFLAVDEPDAGPIISQRILEVTYPARVGVVIDSLCPLYYDLALEVCEAVKIGEPLEYAEQDHAEATYSLWRDEHDYRIDWTQDAGRIVRLVDAVSDPFPGATTTLAGKPCRIHEARVIPDVRIEDRHPGKILRFMNGKPFVVCGSGLVQVTRMDGAVAKRLKERFV